MSIKIGINGFGRIGRMVFRAMRRHEDFELVAVNDLTDVKTLAHLLKYDSVHGRLPADVSAEDDSIVVDGRKIKILSESDPCDLPWADLGAQVILESTGRFCFRADCLKHQEAGATKILLSAPCKDEADATVVIGVNEDTVKDTDIVISNASCTTNCLAPIAKVLNDEFGIVKGFMTTIHAYTGDQKLLDFPHSDLRRARSAALSIIPTSTGAAKAIGLVIPELEGKLDGMAMRVPTPNASVVDLVVELKKDATAEKVNSAMKAASEGRMKGILEYTTDPLVSADVIGNPHSAVFDSLCTQVVEGNLIKVIAWYDNEWGYSNRCVELMKLMAG